MEPKDYRVKVTLKNTGIRRINGNIITAIITVYDGDIKGAIEVFKEEIKQEVNDELLDECKGSDWSIDKSSKFNLWLDNEVIKYEEIN